MKPFFGILLFFVTCELNAQCTISAKREVCINDLVGFSLNIGSGSATAYNWDFGSYGISSNASPLVKVTTQGKLLVSCTATLVGGQSCSDTHEISILPNPTAKAILASGSLQCLNENKICLTDSSKKGMRGIKTVSLLWGDGDIDKFIVPIPKKWCHTYSDTGSFQADFEIADSTGCKDKFSLNIRIFPSVKPLISFNEFLNCDTTKICFKDSSEGSENGSTKWYLQPGRKLLVQPRDWCTQIGPNEEINLTMVSINEFGCKDSSNYQHKSQPSEFYLQKMDSLICINELTNGKLIFYSGEELQWYLNGQVEYIDKKFVAYAHAKLGMNYMSVKRLGGCKGTLKDSFEVIGVRAVGQIYNENRRKTEDTVFLIDYTKAPKGTKLIRMWDFGDLKAAQCTTWTAVGQNIGKNCNFSRDSIGRHFYSDSDCYAARLIITDLVTGCFDDTLMPVYRRNACPKMFLPRYVCLGDYAGFSMPGNMYNKVKDNNYLITDLKPGSDTIVLYGGYGRYLYKSLGFKSPVLWRFYPEDTVWTENRGKIVVSFIRKGVGWVADTFKNEVEVIERSNSEFEIKKLSECDPFKLKLVFKDSIWRYPGVLSIGWGDTIVVYKTWIDSIIKLPHFEHEYKAGGFYSIEVIMTPTKGCPNTTIRSVAFSHTASLRYIAKCHTDAVCFVDSVIDVNSGLRWNKQNNYGKLFWNFGDGTIDSGYNMCHKYNSTGTYMVTLTSISKSGCKTVTKDSIYLNRPIAGIKSQPTIYCSDIRQYFDSSGISAPFTGQKITQWNWSFGDGSGPVSVKNPAHIFPGGGIYNTRLVVKTNLGCTDTVYRSFHVIGPEVGAKILTDSIGCAPLKVDFGNLSKQAKNYIWEYGDPLNTIYSTDRDTNTSFTYNKAGVYFVHIIGGDSFYNPTTGSRYFCSVRYPVPGQKPLRITVFDAAQALFNAPETICADDSIVFENTSNNSKIKYKWNFGNGDLQTRIKDTFSYKFFNSGEYKIVLKPDLPNGGLIACVDSAFKIINVVKLIPDFEQDCSKTVGSNLVLKNKSGKDLPGFEWTLMDATDSSYTILSNQTHLNYQFNNDTGYKIICLGINGGKSCGGRICKSVLIEGDVFFANVFTPGFPDGFNDTYKVPLYGYTNFEMEIFNRWGEKIFNTNNPRVEWNGKVQNIGPELPEGTYFYQIKYKPECAEKPIFVNGSINLIR